jgi:PKHD-type hydroxylase
MYFLAPSPDLSTKETNFATWENGFTESEIASIMVLGELRSKAAAVVGGSSGELNPDIRKSEVSWIENSNESQWLYDKIGWIVRRLNGQFFNFDLSGFSEPFQYTTYYRGGDHYGWHIDKGMIEQTPRKLSIVIQLSNPDEYEGGDLEIQTGDKPLKMERAKGLVVAFPSWILHRVTPVTAGTRRSLVVWTGGPSFR